MGKSAKYEIAHDGRQNDELLVPANAGDDHPQKGNLCGSTRLAIAIVGFLGCMNVYALRVNLSLAMICMVNQTALAELDAKDNSTENATAPECSNFESNKTILPTVEGEFVWTKDVQGYILGSFFYGYLLTQVLGGIMAHRYGARWVLGINIFLASVVTFLTPLAARLHFGALIVLRIVLGFNQGVNFPAFHTLWSHWAPPMERSVLTSINYAGAQVGNVLALPIAAVLCENGFAGGWPSIFYVFGISGVLWVVLWMAYVSDTPATHRRISAAERQFIMNSLSHEVSDSTAAKKRMVPWKQIFTSLPVWAILVGHWVGDWGAYIMFTCLPSFMSEVLGLDIKTLGFLASIPYVAYFVCINVAGLLADFVRNRQWLTTAQTRKAAMVIALVSQAVFTIGAGHCQCGHEMLAVALLTIGIGLSGFQYAGFIINYMDIAPTFAGTILGIGNTLSCISGILAPLAMGALTPNNTRGEWLTLFYLNAAILIGGTIFYCIFASGDIQRWAQIDDSKEKVALEIKENPRHESMTTEDADLPPSQVLEGEKLIVA